MSDPATLTLFGPPSPADQFEHASRIFLGAHEVALRLGVDAQRAARFACERTKQLTGVDWRKELTLSQPAQQSLPRAAPEWGETQPIQHYIQGRDLVVAEDVCQSALEREPTCRATRMRLADVMRHLGWRKQRMRVDGLRRVVYRPRHGVR